MRERVTENIETPQQGGELTRILLIFQFSVIVNSHFQLFSRHDPNSVGRSVSEHVRLRSRWKLVCSPPLRYSCVDYAFPDPVVPWLCEPTYNKAWVVAMPALVSTPYLSTVLHCVLRNEASKGIRQKHNTHCFRVVWTTKGSGKVF